MTTQEKARHTFATLMQTSRHRELTYKERLALSKARQELRRSKRPAMNKPKTKRKSSSKARTLKSNPGRVVIYGRVLQIKAQKASDSNFPGEHFYHNFKSGAVAYGLPNGDILIRKEK